MGKQIIIFILFLGSFGCISDQQDEPKDPVVPTVIGLELDQQPMTQYGKPLPSKQNIYAIWHYSDQKTKRVLSYKGWDFNNDGRIDMLEILSLNGDKEAMAFDFDADGIIDMIKKRRKVDFDISKASNMPEPPKAAIIAH